MQHKHSRASLLSGARVTSIGIVLSLTVEEHEVEQIQSTTWPGSFPTSWFGWPVSATPSYRSHPNKTRSHGPRGSKNMKVLLTKKYSCSEDTNMIKYARKWQDTKWCFCWLMLVFICFHIWVLWNCKIIKGIVMRYHLVAQARPSS